MMVSATHAFARKPTQEQAAEIRAELAAILASDTFSSSKRCQDFLEFVVEHALAGDFESLTERFLGVELFGRRVDYETATDSIVRVRANDVRRRLAQYYAGQRSTLPTRIDLIAGGYIPEFHWSSESEAYPRSNLANPTSGMSDLPSGAVADKPFASGREREEEGQRFRKVRQNARLLVWGGLALTAIVAIGLTFGTRLHRSNFDRFWHPVLDAQSSPVLSLPTTDTFQLGLDPTRTLDQWNRLKSGESLELGAGDVLTFHDWHVSWPVLQATLSVALALERKGKIPLVRIGTDLRRDELRGHPIIAIGSVSNPWTEQNVSGLRFTFDRGASDTEPPRIRDAQDPKRSWLLPHIYPGPQDKDYAIVTRTFDPVTRAPFLSLAGLHSFGNQIAGEFVAQDASWTEVARRAPPGWEKMNLQVVLETNIVGTTPTSPRIVAVYFWK